MCLLLAIFVQDRKTRIEVGYGLEHVLTDAKSRRILDEELRPRFRSGDYAGGLEAGMTNGQPLVVRAAKKPISTLRKPLESINLQTKQSEAAAYERSDVCAVSAASVIIENVVAFEVACALVEKFGGDSLAEMKGRWNLFLEMARQR